MPGNLTRVWIYATGLSYWCGRTRPKTLPPKRWCAARAACCGWLATSATTCARKCNLPIPTRITCARPQLPIFRIRPAAADLILSVADLSLADLFVAGDIAQEGPGWSTRDLDQAVVRMSLTLSEPEQTAVPTVLGYLPGSDLNLAGELVVVFAHYDGLGVDPDGDAVPGRQPQRIRR